MPFGVRGELARSFGLTDDRVRVIVPDVGGGFGGKHSANGAVEAARLARSSGKTRPFAMDARGGIHLAYFRPAGVIEAEASLDDKGDAHKLGLRQTSTPAATRCSLLPNTEEPGAVRSVRPSLASWVVPRTGGDGKYVRTGSFMDEMAGAAGQDPLAFRLAHLDAGRLRDVLEEAAKRFNWESRSKKQEKKSAWGWRAHRQRLVRRRGAPRSRLTRIRERSPYGTSARSLTAGSHQPRNLMNQVKGAIVMGIGPALREEMQLRKARSSTRH